MVNKKCYERNIDFTTYIRHLIDRDLLSDDALPTLEKKFIEHVIERELGAQTRQILSILDRNISQNLVKKINEIYLKTGGTPARIACLTEELCALAMVEYTKINLKLSDNFDEKARNIINNEYKKDPERYDKNKDADWDELGNTVKNMLKNHINNVKKQQEDEAHKAEKQKELRAYYAAQRKENYTGDILSEEYFKQIFDKYKNETDMGKYDDMIEYEKAEIKKKINHHVGTAGDEAVKLDRETGIDFRNHAIHQGWYNRLRQTPSIEAMEEEARKIRGEETYKNFCEKTNPSGTS
jgi:tRNA U38,U39,U40 pseudouridine synthase TruA